MVQPNSLRSYKSSLQVFWTQAVPALQRWGMGGGRMSALCPVWDVGEKGYLEAPWFLAGVEG